MRMTVTLSDELGRALRLEAAATDRTVGDVVENALRAVGLRPEPDVDAIVQRAREHANLSEDEALAIGLAVTRAVRAERSAQVGPAITRPR